VFGSNVACAAKWNNELFALSLYQPLISVVVIIIIMNSWLKNALFNYSILYVNNNCFICKFHIKYCQVNFLNNLFYLFKSYNALLDCTVNKTYDDYFSNIKQMLMTSIQCWRRSSSSVSCLFVWIVQLTCLLWRSVTEFQSSILQDSRTGRLVILCRSEMM